MSGATPTLIPCEPRFPRLLPKPPQPQMVPFKRERVYEHLNAYRDIQREMDDLSDEENELEELNNAVRNRGHGFYIPIGRNLTRQDEKNETCSNDGTESESPNTGGPPSVLEDDGENESAPDLDASMEDLDEDVTGDTEDTEEMNEGETEEFEEESSDLI